MNVVYLITVCSCVLLVLREMVLVRRALEQYVRRPKDVSAGDGIPLSRSISLSPADKIERRRRRIRGEIAQAESDYVADHR